MDIPETHSPLGTKTHDRYTLEKTEGDIKNGHSRDTLAIRYKDT